MRFLVFADLHLDRAFEDVGPDHAARPRLDSRACLDRIVALAETYEVDAILSVGGLYEHRRVQPETASFLVDRLGQAGRPVFLAPGAEDPHTPDSVYATATWPVNVHVFDTDLLVPVELADGFWLWGAAHLGRGATIGFLDGFRISDDTVNLAMFHGSEVGASGHDAAPVVAPFRAEQVEHAGLTHAFVGGARAVDGPWHTVPGTPRPLDDGDPDPQGVVIVDVSSDGSLRRERFTVAGPPVHEVTIDLTDAATDDEVIERMITAVEDLQGVVHVNLQGQPAADVVVHDEDITSWSTRYLEIVLAPRPAAPPWPPEVEQPAPPTPPVRLDTPSTEAVLEVTAAYEDWQETLARLRRHQREEPAPAQRPDLGGLGLDVVEAHLETLRAHPAARQPAPAAEVPQPQAPPAPPRSRPRAIARAAAALVTVASAIGLLIIGETALERGAAVAALAVLVVIVVIMRRGAAEDAELAASRAQVRTTLLLSTELSTASAQAHHTATSTLGRAGLPTDVDQLAALVETARQAEGQQAARAAWEQRRAALATDLEDATSRLRGALQRGGIADAVDIEAAWACFQARAARNPEAALPSPTTPTSEARLVVGW